MIGKECKGRKGERDLVHLQRAKIHGPVLGSEVCPRVYVEAYIPKEIHFFFNAIVLHGLMFIYANVFVTKFNRRSTTWPSRISVNHLNSHTKSVYSLLPMLSKLVSMTLTFVYGSFP